jgi:hypothetical protein
VLHTHRLGTEPADAASAGRGARPAVRAAADRHAGDTTRGAALAALVVGRGAVVTVAAIAAMIGLPVLVLARDLLRAVPAAAS